MSLCCVLLLFSMPSAGVVQALEADAPAAKVSRQERLVREAHAVPPVGWRRTNRGWEFMQVSYMVKAKDASSKPWHVQAAWTLRRVSPLWIAAAMIAIVAVAAQRSSIDRLVL